MRTPAQARNYALARERGQQNQKEILRRNDSNWNTKVAHLSARKTQPALLSTPQNTKQYPQCWRCGGSITPNHNNNCPARISQCNICKKPGHFAKLCRSQLPPVPKNRGQYQQRQNQQSRNVQLEISAPAGVHRATGMVERLIQTIKQKLGVMAIDLLWSSEDITKIV